MSRREREKRMRRRLCGVVREGVREKTEKVGEVGERGFERAYGENATTTTKKQEEL